MQKHPAILNLLPVTKGLIKRTLEDNQNLQRSFLPYTDGRKSVEGMFKNDGIHCKL